MRRVSKSPSGSRTPSRTTTCAGRRSCSSMTWPRRPRSGGDWRVSSRRAAACSSRSDRAPSGPRTSISCLRRCRRPSTGRAATRPASARLNTGTPCSSRSARLAAATFPRRGYTAIARSSPWRPRRCWRDSTAARRRCSSVASARAACCCGRRRSTSRGSDFPLKPVFLPFVHRVARHLSGYCGAGALGDRRPGARRVVWRRNDTAGRWRDRDAVRPPGAPRRRGLRGARADGAGILRASQPVGRRGLRRGGEQRGLGRIGSDGAWIPRKSWPRRRAGDEDGPEGRPCPLPPDAQERSQRLWWYLLVLGILVLGADTLISNRLSKS